MAEESAKRRKQRALNAFGINDHVTPSDLADWLNGPAEIYPKLPEVTTDQARELLDQLHEDGEVVSAGGSRYKLPSEKEALDGQEEE